jgi:DNA-binding ferritin-like protein
VSRDQSWQVNISPLLRSWGEVVAGLGFQRAAYFTYNVIEMRAKGHSLNKFARKLQVAKAPKDMLMELCADNQQLTRSLRSMHEICDQHKDVATASLIENWIDETERRTWFLSEIKRDL